MGGCASASARHDASRQQVRSPRVVGVFLAMRLLGRRWGWWLTRLGCVCVVLSISTVTTLHVLAALLQVGTSERSFFELFAKVYNLRVEALVEHVVRLLFDRHSKGSPNNEMDDIIWQAEVSADGDFPLTGPLVLLHMLIDERNEAAIVSGASACCGCCGYCVC